MKKGQSIWVVARDSDIPLRGTFTGWRGTRVVYSGNNDRKYSAMREDVFLSRDKAFDVAIHRLQAACIARVATVESNR